MTIPKADRDAGIPLTFLQESVWIRRSKDEANSVFRLPVALRFRGPVDAQVLEDAFGVLISRHESLRTNIVCEKGRPLQRIHQGTNWTLDVKELSGLNVAEAEREAFLRMEREARVPFDLENDCLLRATLYRLSGKDSILFVNLHPIIGDPRSLNVLATEITQLCHSFSKKEWPSLHPLPVQYGDFAAWQRSTTEETALDLQRAYWLERLADSPPFEFPTDFVRPAESTGNSEVVDFEIPKQAVRGIRSFAKKEKASAEVILLAAFFVFLHRYSGRDRVCFGWMHSNRGRAELPPLIGLFSNTLPLRADLTGNPRFLDLLGRIKETAETAREQCDIPFDEIVELTKGNRPASSSALTQVTFAYDKWDEIPSEEGLDVSLIDTLSRSPGVDLSVELVETGGKVRGRAEYRADVFKRETIGRMMTHFGTLISDVVRDPARRLGRFELLPPKERKQILSDWNRTGVKYSKSVCVHSLFEDQAEETPDQAALIRGEEVLTYRELNREANRLAHYLRKQGVSRETLVAVNLDLSFELVIGLLGIIKAGGAYVPLDPTYPSDRLRMILDDCGARFLLTKEGLSEEISDRCERVILVDRDWGKVEGEPDSNPHNPLAQDNLFYVTYTSGSTGRPKGVAGIYQGIINRIHWMWDAFPFSEDEVCSMKTSPSFVDHAAEIFCPLLKGIPLVVFSREEARDVGKTVDLIIEKGITRVVLVPSQLRKILAMRKEKVFQLTELRYVFCSGEALPVRLAKQFYQEIRNAKLVNIYGSTEVSADVTYYEVKRFHVDDVLKYFTRSVEFPGGLMDDSSYSHPNPMDAGRVTTADVGIDQVARRFTSSTITEFPITLEEYYKKLNADVLPFAINTAAPTFIGHMTSALPDFVHDLSKLISQLNQNLVKLETGKSLIFLEREALAILHRCFYEFPDAFYEANAQQVNMNLGLITTGGTTANVMALLTARNKALFEGEENPSDRSIYALLREKGYEDMTILGSRLMHYSMQKATSVLGLGIETITYVDTDRTGALDMEDLARKVEECRRKKVLVLAIVGIAGATETGLIEPLDEMGDLAHSHGIHYHVDAAWGGTAILSDKHKTKLRGIQKADSITFCGHKQLYLPQGISVCLFKDPLQAQYGATSATYQAAPDTYDVGRFTLEGSRSAISLVLHAALRLIGKKGYELLVDSGIEQARFFADVVKMTEGFELIGYPELNIVNYRYIPVAFRSKLQSGSLSDEDNRKINYVNGKIQETQFYRGKTFVSKTTLFPAKYGRGKEILVFRVVLSNPLTTQADIYSVIEDQLAIVEELFGEVNEVSFDDKGHVSGSGWESAFTRKPVFVDEYQEAFVPIGKPLANCKAYILDKYGNPTPVGIPGELHVAGAGVSRGYFNMPDLTEEVFVPDPFSGTPDTRMVKTGDRARFLHDGNIEYLGRLDDQVKIQGFRIEVAEIESVLGEIEYVQQCAVVARSDAEGNKYLVAYIVPEKGGQDMSGVRRTLAEKLPEYMVPSLIEVIEAMPLTPSGKTDKKALTRGRV